MKHDTLYMEEKTQIADFNFSEETAAVFDDMLDRSIPQYGELQRTIGEIANEFAQDGSSVYDLGCSTGITLDTINGAVGAEVRLIGVDYSEPMLVKAGERFARLSAPKPLELVRADLNQEFAMVDASVVLLNLTLQFIRPLNRERLLKNVYAGLKDNGCLILVEKVLGDDSLFNRLFIKLYYDMKRRNGYSETQIAHKREALENVLIPYRLDENIALLKKSGFSHIDVFFKWYNFCGLLAVKKI